MGGEPVDGERSPTGPGDAARTPRGSGGGPTGAERAGDDQRRSRRRGRRRPRGFVLPDESRSRKDSEARVPAAVIPAGEARSFDLAPAAELEDGDTDALAAAGPGDEPEASPPAEPLVHVAFRGGRVEAFGNPREVEVRGGDYIVVEAERGVDLGRVVACTGHDRKRRKSQPLRAIVRHATRDEIERLATIMAEDREALEICRGRASHFELEMKVIDAETQFDGNRVTFYFTADHRVDFRELVRDLASIFRTRIELRQVGARDAARRCDGMGLCGRSLCCNTFLREFEPVTLKMAKEQSLALNPAKISGACGRLMCCLTYECAAYQQASRQAPGLGSCWTLAGRTVTVRVRDVGNHRVFVEDEAGQLEPVDLDLFTTGQATPAPRVEAPAEEVPENGDHEPNGGDGEPTGPRR